MTSDMMLVVPHSVFRIGFSAAASLRTANRAGVPCRHYTSALQLCTATSPFKESSGIAGADPSVSVIVNGKKQLSPKVLKLASDICELNLLETADLCEALKVRWASAGDGPRVAPPTDDSHTRCHLDLLICTRATTCDTVLCDRTPHHHALPTAS
jgi:hypothetical protein